MVPANEVTAEITVSRGDKIHFEVKKTAAKDDNYHGIWCDPIVTYTEVYPGPETRDFFKASEKFDLTSGGLWDNGVWQAMFYEWEESTYKAMPYVKGSNYTSQWGVAADYNWGDRGALISETGMRAEVYEAVSGKLSAATDLEKSGSVGRDYPVKAFIAPKAGTVVIDAEILAPATDGKGQNARIMKMKSDGTTIQVWPESGYYNFTTAVDFAPVLAELAKDDKLLFEGVYLHNSENANDPWASAMNWDPTVTYVPAPETRTTFKASEYFNFTSSNFGEWDGGVWKAMHYDFNSTATNERDKYLPMVNKKNETGGMTFLSQPSADDNWSHGDRACWVAKTRMRNELQKGRMVQMPTKSRQDRKRLSRKGVYRSQGGYR